MDGETRLYDIEDAPEFRTEEYRERRRPLATRFMEETLIGWPVYAGDVDWLAGLWSERDWLADSWRRR